MLSSRRLNKEELRSFFLSLRKEIPPALKRLKSDLIARQLFSSDFFSKSKRVFCYLSLPEEVQTDIIIERALKEGKKVFAPALKNNEILPARLKDLKMVEIGPLGIRQPEQSAVDAKTQLDLIIVPGLAFDRKLFRLGFGKGYFDRFLTRYKGKVPLIGLGFSEQLVERLLVDPWDVPLDEVLTDSGWLKN